MKKKLNKYKKGWNKTKIAALIKHYEEQTEDEEVADDEAAFNDPEQTVVLVPRSLLPKVNQLLSAHTARKNSSAKKLATVRHPPNRRRLSGRVHAA
jgi:hypothetical protein